MKDYHHSKFGSIWIKDSKVTVKGADSPPPPPPPPVENVLNSPGEIGLRLHGIMVGRHFHASMKVQTAMCKDNNNSKSKAATYVKFDIYILFDF